MISFNADQMQDLERARMNNVLVQIGAQLMEQYPDVPNDVELQRQLAPLADQVFAWGIRSGGFVALHVLASRAIGVDYFTLPGFERVFADPAISDMLKEEWLSGWMKKLIETSKRGA